MLDFKKTCQGEQLVSRDMRCKQWAVRTVSTLAVLLVCLAGVTVIIDPVFHYHAPLKYLQYPFVNAYYCNDGIVRNFQYDAMITGTSMVENFKTSESDMIFGTHTIKVASGGISFKTVDALVRRGLSSNPDLKLVIRGLDFNRLSFDDVDAVKHADKFPNYLYNDNPFDDVEYVLNKSVLIDWSLGAITYTRKGKKTTSFDDYGYWAKDKKLTYGKETLDKKHTHKRGVIEQSEPEQSDYDKVHRNILCNAIEVAKMYPEVDFYYFVTPYSIYYFDSWHGGGQLRKAMLLHEYAIKEMLEVPNIKVYSFIWDYSITTNLSNYKDDIHYGEWINSRMLEDMKSGKYLVTKDNFGTYCDEVNKFYLGYNYDDLFE